SYSGGVFVSESRDSLSMRDHPVVEISWFGAVLYCNWLSEITGLTPVYETVTWTANFANDGYHLPTEAQWECAAAHDVAAPTQDHWRYGQSSDSISSTDANYNGNNPLSLTAYPYTSPVGYYDGANGTTDSPSPVGAYDMSGNVWEWCHDWYGESYYGVSPGTDPEGPPPDLFRVARGGGWYFGGYFCRSAARVYHAPSSDYSLTIGFRVAQTP
ncbi:MAG: formylglycine-generating enzyme family protein, partial [bacterium]|nr:formylglycine-generating enzyme family protein [bacterium]